MTANIDIYTEQDKHVLLIPSLALMFKPDSLVLNHYITIKSEDKQIKSKGIDEGRTTFSNNKILSEGEEGQKAFVWIKRGDSLIQKKIEISLNDDTYVKVNNGISMEDEIVVNALNNESENKDATRRSPFMPQMPRRPSGGNRGN